MNIKSKEKIQIDLMHAHGITKVSVNFFEIIPFFRICMPYLQLKSILIITPEILIKIVTYKEKSIVLIRFDIPCACIKSILVFSFHLMFKFLISNFEFQFLSLIFETKFRAPTATKILSHLENRFAWTDVIKRIGT